MCQFSISFAGDAESLLQRARQAIEGAGGTLTGSTEAGEFQASTPIGSIEGSFMVQGQQIALSITKKPFLLSCSRIEKELSAVMK